MYISNRKHAYKVIRTYKKNKDVKCINRYGAVFVTTLEKMESNGYKFVKTKPRHF